jgi:hypothetical protein
MNDRRILVREIDEDAWMAILCGDNDLDTDEAIWEHFAVGPDPCSAFAALMAKQPELAAVGS